MKTRAKQPELKMGTVMTSEGPLPVPFEIRRSRRSRWIRMWIGDRQQVVLSIPWRTSHAEGTEFMKGQGNWIAGQLKQVKARPNLLEFIRREGVMSVGGESWPVKLSLNGHRTRVRLDRDQQQVAVAVNPHRETEISLLEEVRALAKEVLTERTRALAGKIEVEAARIVVRDQRSRWGSCSGKREISLNWRLIFLKPELQDYVILHELAHLQEMNHSARFWELLHRYDPLAGKHDRMLNPISDEVMSVGRL